MPRRITYECEQGCKDSKYIFNGAMIAVSADRMYPTTKAGEEPLATMKFSICEQCIDKIGEEMQRLAGVFIDARKKKDAADEALKEQKATAEAAAKSGDDVAGTIPPMEDLSSKKQ